MVLRLASVPAGGSLDVLDAHVAALQQTGWPVVLVCARYPSDFLVPRLNRTDPARLAVIDACAPLPPRSIPGLHVEHVAGPHLVELVELRLRRVMERVLRRPAHIVHHDLEALTRVLPEDVAAQALRDLARASSPDTWTDLIVPEAWRMPASLRTVADAIVPAHLQVVAGSPPAAWDRRLVI